MKQRSLENPSQIWKFGWIFVKFDEIIVTWCDLYSKFGFSKGEIYFTIAVVAVA